MARTRVMRMVVVGALGTAALLGGGTAYAVPPGEPGAQVVAVPASGRAGEYALTVSNQTPCPPPPVDMEPLFQFTLSGASYPEDGYQEGLGYPDNDGYAAATYLIDYEVAPQELTVQAACFDVNYESGLRVESLRYEPVQITVEAARHGTFEIDEDELSPGGSVTASTGDRCPLRAGDAAYGVQAYIVGPEPDVAVAGQPVALADDGTIPPVTVTVPADAKPGAVEIVLACQYQHGEAVIEQVSAYFTPVAAVIVDAPTGPPSNVLGEVFLRGLLTLDQAVVAPGDRVTVHGTGFAPGGVAHLELHSGDPVGLGSAAVSADGSFTASVTIPGGTAAGAHTIDVTESDYPQPEGDVVIIGATGSITLTVLATLPATGSSTSAAVAVSLSLILAGAVMRTLSRRTRASSYGRQRG